MAKRIFEFTVEHADLPKNQYGLRSVETFVESDAVFSDTDFDGFVEALREAAEQVVKNVAGGHLVDLNEGDNDSAYLEQIDRVAAEMTIVSAGLKGVDVRYMANGKYPGREGNLWSDEVYGVCQAEAEFQARMTMACNMEWDQGRTYSELLDRLDDIHVEVIKEPVSRSDLEAALLELVKSAQAGGVEGEAVEKAIALLEANGIDASAPSTPSL